MLSNKMKVLIIVASVLLALIIGLGAFFIFANPTKNKKGKSETSTAISGGATGDSMFVYNNGSKKKNNNSATESGKGELQNNSSKKQKITVESVPAESSEAQSTQSTASKPEKIKYIKYNFKHLANTYSCLTKDKRLSVAFLGGSVTDGTGATNPREDGWPRLVCNTLAGIYNAKVEERRQSIGGTGSYFGAFRYTTDIGSAARQQPDLLFIEFAINDFYNGESYDDVVKNDESLVRKAYSLNPKMDIVFVLTFDELRKNEDYEQLSAHKAVAEKYGLLCINLREILGPTIDFKSYYSDGVHPNTDGYQMYANVINDALLSCMPSPDKGIAKPTVKDKVLPKAMCDYYKNPSLVQSYDIKLTSSKNWEYSISDFSYLGRKYGGKIMASKKGAKLVIKFKGDSFGLVYEGGTKFGKADVSVDGTKVLELNGKLDYSNPRIVRVPISKKGEHTVTVTLTEDKDFAIAAYLYN